jgi:hypothetical protein
LKDALSNWIQVLPKTPCLQVAAEFFALAAFISS